MKYSIVNGERKEAFPSGTGICEVCNQPTLAKCGSRKVHHWAHVSLLECDKWWESETEWHRDWKNKFPSEWQEKVHKDEISGELHRADVKTNLDLVIELQNSPISFEEQTSREKFYKKMIWIVNGEKFTKRFHILDKLPNPDADFVRDIVFRSTKKKDLGKSFFRHSLNPDLSNPKYENQLFLSSNMKDIEVQIEKSYIGHHLYEWINPRKNWISTQSTVFIDFGDDNLYYLMNYSDDYKLSVVRIYSKEEILKRLLKSV